MISAILAWGIGFGGVNYLPTHGFTPAVVATIDRNTFPGATQDNTFTGAQQSNAMTGATYANRFAGVKHSDEEAG